ncbi:hypothetical protein OIU84_026694 [Salix udensis]|uniref:Uncharacterized protein n=1 Tax=Salix udensis TaxID=889485 RepID=A0AAD6PE49_9ROSI|nr:hypothetical protein OIU84_026694 [Salix udensis]
MKSSEMQHATNKSCARSREHIPWNSKFTRHIFHPSSKRIKNEPGNSRRIRIQLGLISNPGNIFSDMGFLTFYQRRQPVTTFGFRVY